MDSQAAGRSLRVSPFLFLFSSHFAPCFAVLSTSARLPSMPSSQISGPPSLFPKFHKKITSSIPNNQLVSHRVKARWEESTPVHTLDKMGAMIPLLLTMATLKTTNGMNFSKQKMEKQRRERNRRKVREEIKRIPYAFYFNVCLWRPFCARRQCLLSVSLYPHTKPSNASSFHLSERRIESRRKLSRERE